MLYQYSNVPFKKSDPSFFIQAPAYDVQYDH